MPRIPQILARNAPTGFLNSGSPRSSAPDLSGLTRGVTQLDNAVYSEDQRVKREAEAEAKRKALEAEREQNALELNEARIQVVNTTGQLEADWTEKFAARQQQAPTDAAGFTRETLADFDARAKEAEAAATEKARPILREQLAHLRVKVHQKSLGFEMGARQAAVLVDADNGIETDARTAFADPGQYAELLARRAVAIGGLSADPVTRGKLIAKATDQITLSAALGRVERDPEGVLRTLGFGGEAVPTGGDERRIDPAVQYARDQERLRILKGEQADTKFDTATREAVGREVTRLETQLAKGPPAATKPVTPQQIASAAPSIQSDPVFANLPPDKLAPVLHRAQTLIAQRRAEAERAAREGERQIAAQAKSYIGMLNDGDQPPAQALAAVKAAAAGTVYAPAIAQAEAQASVIATFRGMPLATQGAQLRQMQVLLNDGKLQPEQRDLFEKLQQVNQKAEKALTDDPMAGAVSERILPQGLAPIQTATPETLVQSIDQRAQQARVVAAAVGRPVSPLTNDEADAVGAKINALPVEQRSAAVANLARAIGPQQSAAIAKQLAPKDRTLELAFGLSTSATTQGRFTSQLLLTGAQALKDKGVKDDNSAETGVRATVSQIVGDALSGKARQDVIDSARLIYYGMQAEGSTPDASRAVKLAIGGDVVSFNAKRIPVPAGYSADSLPAGLLAGVGASLANQAKDGALFDGEGKPLTVAQLVAGLPTAQLDPAGLGRYFVRSGSRLVTTSARRPLVIEVPSVAP